ncbi:MAG TPA: ATP synthase subunit I [Bryobacteraceae bacterium]|nr:ATP synthase subunit I [Bryobacteraceae bacterium]
MTEEEAVFSVRQLYWLTTGFGVLGFLCYLTLQGARPAFAFLLGALGAAGNLWLFERMTRGIAPGDQSKKPAQAGAFAIRYVLLFSLGYVIVKSLGVNPLAVILGLLASTAAVLTSSLVELAQGFLLSRNQH